MEALSVFLHDVADQQIYLQLDENTTAQEVLRQITGKNQMIKEAELHEYALFIRLDAAEGLMLKERMLSSHECPLKIKVNFI